MKISLPKQNFNMMTKEPLLPLVPKALVEELNKSNSTSYECRTTPANTDSAKCKLHVRTLMGEEDIRTIMKWIENVVRVMEGMNITTIVARTALVETMMVGTPIMLHQTSIREQATVACNAAYEAAADDPGHQQVIDHGIDHYREDDMFLPALRDVFTNLIPKQALPRIKRCLRRECRKPADVKVRTYCQHLARIVLTELPQLPPFIPNQMLQTDEVMDILIHGVPKSWAREMDHQGFDPWTHDPQDVVTFLEQIETAEERHNVL